MKEKVGILLVFILTFLVLVGCSIESEESTTKNSKETEVNDKNERKQLRVAMSDQPLTLDRHLTTALSTEHTSRLINETLVTIDSNYKVVPLLAKTVEQSDDGKTITFNLREGVKFHNGNEMTSDDVAASMNRWKELYAIAKEKLSDATFEAIDKYVVKLSIQEPKADIMDILASETAAIMPKDIIESAGPDGVTEYIGTGPFKFEEWKQDQYIHFTKFNDYQPVETAADGLSGKKEALVDDIYIEFVPDSSAKLAGIQTGEYDVAFRLPYDNYQELENNPNVKTYMDSVGHYSLMYNKKQGPAANVKIRQAINAALNTEEIMMAAFPHKDFHTLSSSYMDQNIEHWASDAGSEAYNQKDQDKSKKLLEEAGYNGEEVVLLTHREADFLYDGAVVIQQQLEQVGLNVELKITDSATVKEIREDPNEWDLLMVTTTTVTSPSQVIEISPSWVGWMEDQKVKNLIEAIENSAVQSDAKEIWDDLQEYLWIDYLPITRLGSFKEIYASTSQIEGFSIFKGPILWNTKVNKK